jgi:PAS domain S-box-containing protein
VRVRTNTSEADPVSRPSWLRYCVAVLAVGVVLLVKLLLDPLITEQSPFLLLAGAVMVGAWFGGFGPGLLATALGAFGADYFFLPPEGSFTGPGVAFLPLALFAVQGLVISLLTEALRSTRQRANASTLEARSHLERLRQSEKLYRTVVEQAAENIFLVDAETKRILEGNAAFYASLGYRSQQLKRMTLYDIVAHDRESVDRNVERTMREGHRSIGERQYRRKDGSLIDVEVGASLISYGGREVLCVVAHDVTERKRAEEALRRSLDALLALYETGQLLSSSLKRDEIGSSLLRIIGGSPVRLRRSST